jgi:hypothetical protein
LQRWFADIDAELEKLAMNPWCAPQWVGETHLANEMTDFPAGSSDGHRAVLISSANTLECRHDATARMKQGSPIIPPA